MSNVQVIEHREIAERPANTALTPMDMLNTALSRGADIAVLEKLMALHERFEAGQARKAFDAAISAAKSKIGPVGRNATGHNNKRYADFAAIARAVDPVLSQHGLSYRFRTAQTDRIFVTCILSHKDGHSEETTLGGPADTSGSKNAIQAIGSTLSYLQRYSLVQALGLASGEDDDGRAVGTRAPEDDGPTLSDEQIKQIEDAIAFKGVNREKFLKYVLKVSALENVYATKFETILKMIRESGAAQ